MHVKNSKCLFGLILASLAGVGAGTACRASEAADAQNDSAAKLDEIVVTAQKRQQNLQDVGTSVTALDSAALARLGLKDVTELAMQVPGLQYNQFGATVTVFNLRGVSQNDFSDHQEAPIAVYEDDAYVAMPGAFAGSMYDLQRVEVLRGPQGTLFGRNATGGLIQYISQKPTDTLDGYFQASTGNFGDIESEGALSGPLTNIMSGRLSFATEDHSGYITNLTGTSIENQRQAAARLQLLIKPSDSGEILIKLHGVNNDHESGGIYSWAPSQPNSLGQGHFVGANYLGNCPQANGGCTPGADDSGYRNNSNNYFVQSENGDGIFNRTVWGANVHVNWNFSGFSLTSVSDYLTMQKRYGEDTSLSPVSSLSYNTLQHYYQLSEELRLNGTHGPLTWIAGVYYLDYLTNNFIGVDAIPAFGGTSYGNFTLSDHSPSAFAQLEYALTDRWTVIGGARYTYDIKSFDYNFQPQGLNYYPGTFPDAAKNFSLPTWKAEIDYKADRDVLLYGSVSRGAKGGGWSAPNSGLVDPAQLAYQPEKLTSYEIGEKATFWNGAARLNTSLYYYDYKNYQGFFIVGLASYLKNVNAQDYGGEMEFAVVPMKGMNLQVGVSNIESQVYDVPEPGGQLITTQLPQAPKWSLNAAAQYEWTLPSGSVAFDADSKWNKSQYLELINAPVDVQPSYVVTNARLTYKSRSGSWEVGLYGKNIFDRVYRQYNLDLSSVGWNLGVYAPPRLYGVTATYHLGK